MRFHSLRLRHYRGITETHVDFGAGVTVVEGPNEIGKSSLHEAITHLREDKASSKKAGIKDTQPVGVDAGPEVELHLSSGDYEMKYRKRWLRQPVTELSVLRPRPEQHSGDEAHERFQAILAETVDVDLLIALDVAQGESLAQASLAQIKALHSALSDSGAELVDHDAFIDRLETEYSRFFTARGKETGAYRDSAAEVIAAQAAYDEILDRSQEMDSLVEQHARAVAQLESVRTQQQQAVVKLADLESRSQVVSGLRQRLERAKERAASARRDFAMAVDARDRRSKLVEESHAARETVQTRAEIVERLDTGQKERDEAFAAAALAADRAGQALDRAREVSTRLARAVERAGARVERGELVRRLQEIAEYEEKMRQAQALIDSIPVTQSAVEALAALETEVRIAEQAKTAAAARVVIARLGQDAVTVDGQAMATGEESDVAVTVPVSIEIGDTARITVHPGVSPGELDRAVDSAQTAFAAEQQRLQVESVAQARERQAARRGAESVCREAKSALSVLLAGRSRAELEAAVARADQVLADSDDGGPGGLTDDAGSGGAAGPGDAVGPGDAAGPGDADGAASGALRSVEELRPVEELRGERIAAEKVVELAQADAARARGRLEEARTAREEVRVEAVRAQSGLQESRAQLERLETELAAAREAASDEDLATAIDEASARERAANEEVAAAQAGYHAADPETLALTLQNAQRLVESTTVQQEKDRQHVDRLTALIDDRAGAGIYEKLAAAEERLQTARSTRAGLHRQAQAIDLLRSTVIAHRDEAQRKYVAPFKQEIERLGHLVFGPGLSVEVSEELEIVARTLDEKTVPFESLSGGTKEQLALIGRLAVATLVDAEAGAPVILDDAFGFADPQRLSALNTILGHVGDRAQVILLTCQPERFTGIGGADIVRLG